MTEIVTEMTLAHLETQNSNSNHTKGIVPVKFTGTMSFFVIYNGTITNMAVYGVYRGVCSKLGIQIPKDLIRGPHSFQRNAITDVANATNGNMVMASSLFGNSPQLAMSNYYGGANLMDAKDILEQRKYLRFG